MSLRPGSKSAAEALGTILLSKQLTVSTAESCTGGMIGAALSSVPGSSQWFHGGIIAYDNRIKASLLAVPQTLLDKHGAVSEEVVSAMTSGAAEKLATDCTIAVSGIAGPGGGTKEKPVGLVYIGVFYNDSVTVYKNIFAGNREEVREQAVERSIRYLLGLVKKENVE